MKQHWKWVVLTAASLGWVLDFLFWKQGLGVNFAIYAVACLGGGLLVMQRTRQRIAASEVWLAPLILIFAVSTFVRAEPLTLFLSVLLTLLLMAMLAATYLGGGWLRFDLLDHAAAFWRLVRSMLVRPLGFLGEIRSQEARQGGKSARTGPWPVVRGILIALPILIVFAALLGSADAVFGSELQAFLQVFQLQRLPEFVFRLAFMAVAAYALIGVYLHAGSGSTNGDLATDRKPRIPQFLGFVEAGIVLGSVAALFSAFVVIQFQYFFGGQANISVQGYTYAEYARRGFGELLAVAFFSLLMIMAFGTVSRRETRMQQSLFSALSVMIVALVSVMLVSAFQRLSLYEMAYGFSRLRAYVHVSLIWIGLLLAAVVVLQLLHRERLFAAAALISVLGFALSLSVLNVDGFIVRQNVNRAVRGEGLDVPYLVSLSTDSVPVLQAIFESPSYPGLTRDAVGAVLGCRQHVHALRLDVDWRSFTISASWAGNAMGALRTQLAAYRLAEAEGPLRLITPGSVLYECGGYPD